MLSWQDVVQCCFQPPSISMLRTQHCGGCICPLQTIARIEKRLSHISFLPIENGEGLQILHYQVLCCFLCCYIVTPILVQLALRVSLVALLTSSQSTSDFAYVACRKGSSTSRMRITSMIKSMRGPRTAASASPPCSCICASSDLSLPTAQTISLSCSTNCRSS